MASLKPILERKASLQVENPVAFTIHTSNVFFNYNNQVLNKKMLEDA